MQYSDFTESEYAARCKKSGSLMEERGIDCLLLASQSNCFYFSGYRKPTPYLKVFVLLPREQAPVMVLSLSQRGNAEETSWLFPDNIRTFGNVRGSSGPRDPMKVLLEMMRHMGLTNKVIAAELSRMPIDMTLSEYDFLKAGLPEAKLVDAAEILWQMRMVKSSNEIQFIRKSCEITCKAFEAGLESIREGTTEQDIARVIHATIVREGGDYEPGIVIRSGAERYRIRDPSPRDRKIEKGDIVSIDGGGAYKGYCSDILRLACVGKPSETQTKMFKVALDAEVAGVETLRPGAKVGEIASCMGEAIRQAGYEENTMHASHRWGHGLGLEVHEPPIIQSGSEKQLEPGMVVALEPSIWPREAIEYYRTPLPVRGKETGEGTFVVEDNVLITAKGHEILTPLEKDLWIV